MKDRRTKEELIAAMAALAAEHQLLRDNSSEALRQADQQIRDLQKRADLSKTEADSFSSRYYKLLEEHRASEAANLSERNAWATSVDQLVDRGQRYAAMRGAVIALAGKAKADEIDGYV